MRNCTNGDAILKQPGKCLDLPGRITGGEECIMHLCGRQTGQKLAQPFGIGARHIPAEMPKMDTHKVRFRVH